MLQSTEEMQSTEETLNDSVIQPTPGNALQAPSLSSLYSGGSSTSISPKSSLTTDQSSSSISKNSSDSLHSSTAGSFSKPADVKKHKHSTPDLESRPFRSPVSVAEISTINKVELSSSSSDEEARRQRGEYSGHTLEVPGWCSNAANANSELLKKDNPYLKESEEVVLAGTDIFNTDTSNTEEEKQVCSGSPSPDLQMNFELSQDFSQVVAVPKSLPSLPDMITPEEVVAQESKSCQCKKIRDIKNSLKDVKPTCCKKSLLGLCPSCPDPGVEAESTSEPRNFEKPCDVKKNSPVFALFTDGVYYPAIVNHVKTPDTIEIAFEDGSGMAVRSIADVVSNLSFERGQKCLVKNKDGYYYNAEICVTEMHFGEFKYLVRVREKLKLIGWERLCLKREHIKLKTKGDKKIEKKASHAKNRLAQVEKKRKRPVATPVLLNTSGSSSDYPLSKRQKQSNLTDGPLFHDLYFLLTADSNQQLSPTCSSDSEESIVDVPVMDIKDITRIIQEHGGHVIEKIHSRLIDRAKGLVCLSNTFCRTYKYIYCVVVGIPILDVDWLYRSIEAGERLAYPSYVLPAGRSITKDIIEQNYDNRLPYKCLHPLRIYVHQSPKDVNNKDLSKILHKAGAERVAAGVFITNRSRSVTFSLVNVDFILALQTPVPRLLCDACAEHDIPIVTCDWLIECLLNNLLLSHQDFPAYSYVEEV